MNTNRSRLPELMPILLLMDVAAVMVAVKIPLQELRQLKWSVLPMVIAGALQNKSITNTISNTNSVRNAQPSFQTHVIIYSKNANLCAVIHQTTTTSSKHSFCLGTYSIIHSVQI